MTELIQPEKSVNKTPAPPVPEPAIVDQIRDALGTRQHPDGGGRVDRLDLLGTLLAPETATLAVLWLASTRRASPATRRGYADDLIQWASWHARERGGRLDLATLTRADVTLWVAAAQATGHAPATITRRLSALSSLYRYGASHGLPLVCPITEDHRPQVQRGRHERSARVLSPDELRALTGAVADQRDALVVALLLTDGVRVSELCGADDDDVVMEDGRYWLNVTRKGGRSARVALDPSVAELLADYRAVRPDNPDGEQPLVRDAEGRRIDRFDVIRMLRRIARAADISNPATVTPHALRASAITELAERGKPVHHIQKWAGHTHITTTMTYVDAREQDKRNATMTAELAELITRPRWKQDKD